MSVLRRHRLAAGLFFLRVAVAVVILSRSSTSSVVETAAAFLVLGGLWTSAAGATITLIEVWRFVSGAGGWLSVLVAAITSALALTGPGLWSIDDQVRGSHRIEIPRPESDGNARPTSSQAR